MVHSVYDLKDFYNTPMGGVVARVIRRTIKSYWRRVNDMRVVGIGFPQPVLDVLVDEAERVVALNPTDIGCMPWPDSAYNLAALVHADHLPIETNSMDRVVMMHGLEYAESPRLMLQEIYRILKSNGRLLLIVPNRRGLWARTEWSPFGHGTPYSGDQLKTLLRELLFVYERSSSTVFTPPLRLKVIEKSFATWEAILPYLLPMMGGVHVVEVSKQIYSGIPSTADAKIMVRARAATTAATAVPSTMSHKEVL